MKDLVVVLQMPTVIDLVAKPRGKWNPLIPNATWDSRVVTLKTGYTTQLAMPPSSVQFNPSIPLQGKSSPAFAPPFFPKEKRNKRHWITRELQFTRGKQREKELYGVRYPGGEKIEWGLIQKKRGKRAT